MQKHFKELKSSKVLVTGGAGFIAFHLCEKHRELGASVVCLDNFATGKRENISATIEHPNFTLIKGDIRNLETCHTAAQSKFNKCLILDSDNIKCDFNSSINP
ncbi:MAG: NAD-dependent epimerase/dehydratase family protein [Bacteroidota bacterium]